MHLFVPLTVYIGANLIDAARHGSPLCSAGQKTPLKCLHDMAANRSTTEDKGSPSTLQYGSFEIRDSGEVYVGMILDRVAHDTMSEDALFDVVDFLRYFSPNDLPEFAASLRRNRCGLELLEFVDDIISGRRPTGRKWDPQ